MIKNRETFFMRNKGQWKIFMDKGGGGWRNKGQ